jgi:hypothetical protein
MARLCEAVCRPLGIEPPLYPRRVEFFSKDSAADISKARRLLGYSPRISLDEGTHRTAQWYRSEGTIIVRSLLSGILRPLLLSIALLVALVSSIGPDAITRVFRDACAGIVAGAFLLVVAASFVRARMATSPTMVLS